MAIWDDVVPPEERALYEEGGWGGALGFGRRPALLIVDMYTAFVDPAFPFSSPDAPAAVAAIRQVLQQARASGVPVIFSRADRPRNTAERGRWKGTARLRPVMSRSDAYEIVPALAPLPEETVLVKAAASAFHGTNLASLLVVGGVDTVIVTGTVTSGCVRATVVDASAYGFIPVVPIECVYDRGRTSHKVALWDIHTRYGDVLPTTDVLAYLRTVEAGVAPPPAGDPVAESRHAGRR